MVLADALASLSGMRPLPFAADRFANGEWHVTLAEDVDGLPCVVLGSLTPPDTDLLLTLLLCHTLAKEGAAVTAVLPYLAYMRQDRAEACRSRAGVWCGQLAQASGISQVITVDVHSATGAQAWPIPVVSLTPAGIFAEEIRARGWQDATLVAPDEGAIPRVEQVGRAAGISRPVAHMAKTRTPTGVSGLLYGEVSRRAIIIDDMLDTGGTLLLCSEALRREGTTDILVMVTHGLFTGERWRGLWELGVQGIICTDTVPPRWVADEPRIRVRTVAPMLADYLQAAA